MRLCVALMLLVGSCVESDPKCTLVGCDSGASFDVVTIPASDIGRLAGATVEVCLNALCRSMVITAPPAQNTVDYVNLGPDPYFRISLWRTAENGEVEIDADVESSQPELFEDGDNYTIKIGTITDSIVDLGWSVAYQTSQPNGSACGPTCRQATTKTPL